MLYVFKIRERLVVVKRDKLRVRVPFAEGMMKLRVIKVVIIVNKEVLILKGEGVSKDRKVIMVMKSVLNELSDEVGVVRGGRFRRGRFA